MTSSLRILSVPFALLTVANLMTIFGWMIFVPVSRHGIVTTSWILILDALYVLLLIVREILPRIPVGTKSLLFGVHQIFWHPITVFLAWHELYGWPNWKECICMVIHDWGYWGCPNMDGEEGERHPQRGALIAWKYLDNRELAYDNGDIYAMLCLYHSRHYARAADVTPSKLCWADKLSIKYDPWWFYLLRAWASGELFEYLDLHADMGEQFKTWRAWYDWVSERAICMGHQQSSDGITFHRMREET
jgi:hypothetical protein